MSQMRKYLQDPDCIFAYQFNDLADMRNRFTVNGNPTITDSAYGKGMTLNGTSEYVGALQYNSYSAISVCALVMPTDTTGTRYVATDRYNIGGGSGTSWSWILRCTSGNWQAYVEDGANSPVGASAAATQDALRLISFTYDGTTIRLYENASETDNAAAGTPGFTDTDNPILVGAEMNNGTPGNYFEGTIPFLLIFKRTLSATEISNIALNRSF